MTDPAKGSFYPDNYIDDLGYKYRRKDPPYYKTKEDSYTVRYVCAKSTCEALISYHSATVTYLKSKNFTHKCNIEDHAAREIKTPINKVDSKKIEEKIKEDPMKSVMALYEDMAKPSTEMYYKFSTFKNFANSGEGEVFPKDKIKANSMDCLMITPIRIFFSVSTKEGVKTQNQQY